MGVGEALLFWVCLYTLVRLSQNFQWNRWFLWQHSNMFVLFFVFFFLFPKNWNSWKLKKRSFKGQPSIQVLENIMLNYRRLDDFLPPETDRIWGHESWLRLTQGFSTLNGNLESILVNSSFEALIVYRAFIHNSVSQAWILPVSFLFNKCKYKQV